MDSLTNDQPLPAEGSPDLIAPARGRHRRYWQPPGHFCAVPERARTVWGMKYVLFKKQFPNRTLDRFLKEIGLNRT